MNNAYNLLWHELYLKTLCIKEMMHKCGKIILLKNIRESLVQKWKWYGGIIIVNTNIRVNLSSYFVMNYA